MSAKTPAYAKATTITSRSGLNAAVKHRQTLVRAQQLLLAQDTEQALNTAFALQTTIARFSREIAAWYDSDTYKAWKAKYLAS